MATTDASATAVLAALEAVTNLIVFDGGVPDDQEMERDDGGAVKPYACLYMGAGRATGKRHAAVPRDLSLPFQVTVSAGTPRGARWAVDHVRAALTGLRLFPDDPASGWLKEDTDPGPVRKDEAVPSDLRWYLPMQYRFTTTT